MALRSDLAERSSTWLRVSACAFGLAAMAAPATTFLLRRTLRTDPMPSLPFPPKPPALPKPPERGPLVWQVEKAADSESYSNGLRVENRFAVSTRARRYVAFPIDGLNGQPGVRFTRPAGIVFHTTESQQAPFEAGENGHLKRIGESALAYVRRNRSYNFLIDRFGRVNRIVAENEVANHAGYSVWSDESWLYLNLNDSFLGVSFEAETRPGQLEAPVNPAQIHAAAMLTEMLRSKYGIAAGNCVTHGQVSVNASNMQIGYHTDWASSFPFTELGLPNNYAKAIPAMWACGFEANAEFLRATGSRMSAGVALARQLVAEEAARSRLSVAAYRRGLQRSYRERLVVARSP